MTSLARKLAEHPRWRWEKGMHLVGGYIVNRPILIESDGYHELQCYDTQAHDEAWVTEGDQRAEVDIDHPATKGWLLAMLREEHGQGVSIETGCADGLWFCIVMDSNRLEYHGATEGEAPARALLAAWGES